MLGGVLGGTGTTVPTPPPAVRPLQRVVRVGGNLKAPHQTFSVDPAYPPLAREAHIWGAVVVDALIDEHGNVVQVRVLSGHPFLIDAALKAVGQWKYEPTTLNGQPVSVELQVQVHFMLNRKKQSISEFWRFFLPPRFRLAHYVASPNQLSRGVAKDAQCECGRAEESAK